MATTQQTYNDSYKRGHSKRLILALFLFQFWNTASGMQDKNSYQAVMTNIQEVLANTELAELLSKNHDAWLPVQNKLSAKSVRSSFAVWAYQYLSNRKLDYKKASNANPDYLFQVKIPFLVEAIMTHAYLINQVYDKKNGIINEADQQANLAKAANLFEAIMTYIRSFSKFTSSENVTKVQLIALQMIDEIDYGQKLDLSYESHLKLSSGSTTHLGNYPNEQIIDRCSVLDADLRLLKKQYPGYEGAIDLYFQRNYYISSSLFKHTICLVSELLTHYPRLDRVRSLMGFAEIYGFIMQLINDNNDFVFEPPTKNKSADDVLSDLKNGLFTFPLMMHHFKKPNGFIADCLKNPGSINLVGQHDYVLKGMILSGALGQSIKVCRDFAKIAKSYIEPSRIASLYLEKMLDISRDNRYYFHLRKARDFYCQNKRPEDLYRCKDYWSVKKQNPTQTHS